MFRGGRGFLLDIEKALEKQYQTDPHNQAVARQFDFLRDGFKRRKVGCFYDKVEGEYDDNAGNSMAKRDEI